MPAGKTPKRGVNTRKTYVAARQTKVTIKSPPRTGETPTPLTPGWTRAHGDMFTPVVALSPVKMENTPSPFKNRRMTRRSSVYVTSTKVRKSLVTTSPKKFLSAQKTDFKKPALKSRQPTAPKPGTVRSPAVTRAKRASVYVSAQTKSSMVIQETSEIKMSPSKQRKTPTKASKQIVNKTSQRSKSRSKSPSKSRSKSKSPSKSRSNSKSPSKSRSKSKSPSKSRSKSRSRSPLKTPVRVITPLQARRALRNSTRKASTQSRLLASQESSPEKEEKIVRATLKVSPKVFEHEKIMKVTLKTPPKETEKKEQKHKNTPTTATSRQNATNTGLKKVTLQSPQLKAAQQKAAQLNSPRELRIRTPGTPAKAAKVLGKVTITTPSRTVQQTKKQDTPLTSTPVKSTKKRRADGPPPVSEIRQTKLLRPADQNESVFPAPNGNMSVNGVEVTDIKHVNTERMDLSEGEISKLEDEEDDGWLQWCTIL